jgi:hypothetical protein
MVKPINDTDVYCIDWYQWCGAASFYAAPTPALYYIACQPQFWIRSYRSRHIVFDLYYMTRYMQGNETSMHPTINAQCFYFYFKSNATDVVNTEGKKQAHVHTCTCVYLVIHLQGVLLARNTLLLRCYMASYSLS